MASMVATLGATPVACEPGGKMSLMGEDGDVSLQCAFRLTRTVGGDAALHVRVKWSHAQYVGFEVAAE